MSFRGHPFFCFFISNHWTVFFLFLSFFLLPFFSLSNLSLSFFPFVSFLLTLSPSFFLSFFCSSFYPLNSLSFFFLFPPSKLSTIIILYPPLHHLSLFFLYSFKSLCFNGLCSFVKMRVKALHSKRTLNK